MERVRLQLALDDEDSPRQISVTTFDAQHDVIGISVLPIGPFDDLWRLCAHFVDELWETGRIRSSGIQLVLFPEP